MKFSVVIPCYNAERWLEQTLQSVAEQTLPAFEVIVVDDGSSDRSLQLLHASAIPTTVLQTQNLGPSGARNAGIEIATGDWVAFLDADDWWKPDHLARIQTLVGTTEDVAYLAAAEHFSINVNRVVSMSDIPFDDPRHQMSHARYFELYLKHGLLELSSMAVKRDRLVQMGGFALDLRGAEDLELMLRVIHGHTWAYDPVPSSVYRCNNPESHSRTVASSDETRLTAKFRTMVKHQEAYAISPSMLRGLAQTMMSKAITDYQPDARRRVFELARPYLSKSQTVIFAIASLSPWLYMQMNALRQRLKGQQYGPRKVISPSA